MTLTSEKRQIKGNRVGSVFMKKKHEAKTSDFDS